MKGNCLLDEPETIGLKSYQTTYQKKSTIWQPDEFLSLKFSPEDHRLAKLDVDSL